MSKTFSTAAELRKAQREVDSTNYTGVSETPEEFGQCIYLEAWKCGGSRAKKKVVMGDGAEWIWNLRSHIFLARWGLSICITHANTCGIGAQSYTLMTK